MKPTIALTMGDPAGIGPEIVVKALADCPPTFEFNVLVIGESKSLERALADSSLENDFTPVTREELDESGVRFQKSFLDLTNLSELVEYGQEQAIAGKAAGEFIEAAVDLCKNGVVNAVCTAPINKLSFSMGGYDFPGHTEFLADLTSTSEYEMSFFAEDLCVVLLSRHLSIRDALEEVTKENVLRLIRFTDQALSNLIGKRPKIAVAGLNPHASEGGLFGSEEAEALTPAIGLAKDTGIDCSGPYSPDTIFLRGFRGEFDAVIALYHDQATIPVKCLSFGEGVNVTLGLPIIRTSVDHGTAYDIAGKNLADSGSLRSALELAGKLAVLKEN